MWVPTFFASQVIHKVNRILENHTNQRNHWNLRATRLRENRVTGTMTTTQTKEQQEASEPQESDENHKKDIVCQIK